MQLLQYGSMEEVPPRIMSLVHADDAGRVSDCWQAARAQSARQNGTTVAVSVTFRCLRKDGSYVWVESQTCVTPTHLYAVSSDISERMQREASLRGFLASVMADMRQPLSSLQAATELLAARMCVRNDEESAFLVSAIAAGCAMLCGIVSNVLSFRSMEAGDCVVDAVPCSVRDVVASVLSVCRMSLAHRTDVSIVWADEAAALPASVLCDKRLLSQVLLNLLTSACLAAALPRCHGPLTAALSRGADAVKFAEGTQVTVSVACAPAAGAADAAQQLLTLCVADRGRGMSAEEQESCFLPYVRSPTSRGGGTGLGAWPPDACHAARTHRLTLHACAGLYICKRFVEAMGGTLRVQSAPGQGACFTVSLPVAVLERSGSTPPTSPARCSVSAPAAFARSCSGEPVPPPPLLAAQVSPAGSPPGRPPPFPSHDGHRMRCLLVDDHSLNRRLCGKLLELQGGLEVSTADDGDVALQALMDSYAPGGCPVDFCLMDLQARLCGSGRRACHCCTC